MSTWSRTRSAAVALGLALVWLGGCREAPARDQAPPAFDGTFPLAAFRGLPLPARDVEIPTRDGRPSGCFAVVTSGWLTLDAHRGTFSMGVHRQDSCGFTRFGSDASATGRFTQRGAQLELAADLGSGRTEPLIVRVAVDHIQVDATRGTYQFRR